MGIRSEARQKGELVYSFSQGDSDVCTMPGPWGDASSGYCAGLAIRWLQLRGCGRDYPTDQAGTMIPDYKNSTKAQNVYEDTDYSTALAQAWMPIKDTLKLAGPPTAKFIVDAARAKSSSWLISLRRDGGGHAVAMVSDKSTHTYRFFDANYGQFSFHTSERFREWMAEFLQRSGYGARYLKKTILYRAL
jgi:hypothetical protein